LALKAAGPSFGRSPAISVSPAFHGRLDLSRRLRRRPFGAQLDPAASRPRPCLELLIRLDFTSSPTRSSRPETLCCRPCCTWYSPACAHQTPPCRAQLAIARAFGSIKPRRSSLSCPLPSRSSSFAALDEPGRPLSQPHLLPQQCAHHLQSDFFASSLVAESAAIGLVPLRLLLTPFQPDGAPTCGPLDAHDITTVVHIRLPLRPSGRRVPPSSRVARLFTPCTKNTAQHCLA
jgi:hypothetical protein